MELAEDLSSASMMIAQYRQPNTLETEDFMKEKFGAYSCSNCQVFVQHRQCNARKVTEFNWKDNVLTIYHQGKHTCMRKPDVEKQRQVPSEKCKELPPLNRELRNTP